MEEPTTSSSAGTSKRPFPPLGTPFPVIQDPSFQMPVPRFPQSAERPRRSSRPATASIVEGGPLFVLLDPSTSAISSVRVRSPFFPCLSANNLRPSLLAIHPPILSHRNAVVVPREKYVVSWVTHLVRTVPSEAVFFFPCALM